MKEGDRCPIHSQGKINVMLIHMSVCKIFHLTLSTSMAIKEKESKDGSLDNSSSGYNWHKCPSYLSRNIIQVIPVLTNQQFLLQASLKYTLNFKHTYREFKKLRPGTRMIV